jgi:pimeloyl-ACP methyl ester carboxylesterase
MFRPRSLIPLFGLALAALVLGGPFLVRADEPTTQPGDDADELTQLVTRYFQATEPRDRFHLLAQIQRTPDVTIDAVAKAIGKARLWKKQPPGRQTLTIDETAEPPVVLRVEAPQEYDPAKVYPVLMALGEEGTSADEALDRLHALLDDGADQFILAALTDLRGCWFGSALEDADRPVEVFDRLKRRYHVNTNRIYLFGVGRGGHAACSLAAMYPDDLAGVIAVDGTLPVQFSAAEIELFLPNTAEIPVVTVFGDKVAPDIRQANEYIAQVAREQNLPIRVLDLATVGEAGSRDLIKAMDAILTHTRPVAMKRIHHWFRYPVQGRRAWLRLGKMREAPWTAQLLRVWPAVGEDPLAAERAVLEDKLCFVGGEIDGQTIRVQTRGCDEIELLLNDRMLDLDRDVTVYVDGTVRFEGRIVKRIATMLETAQRDWEFERLWSARLQIGRKGQAIQD